MANQSGYSSAQKTMLFVEKTLILFQTATSSLTDMKRVKI